MPGERRETNHYPVEEHVDIRLPESSSQTKERADELFEGRDWQTSANTRSGRGPARFIGVQLTRVVIVFRLSAISGRAAHSRAFAVLGRNITPKVGISQNQVKSFPLTRQGYWTHPFGAS